MRPSASRVKRFTRLPNSKLDLLERKYAKIRARLPLEKGEVKGRSLNEAQINEVVTLLARNEVLFESTAIDLGMHSEQAALAYKKQHGEEMLARVPYFHEDVRPEVEKARCWFPQANFRL